MDKNTSSLQEWADLIEPIPKMAVPIEFVKQIIIGTADGEIVLDTESITSDELANAIDKWIEINHAAANKVSMVVDIEQVRAFIEPITEKYLNKYFG